MDGVDKEINFLQSQNNLDVFNKMQEDKGKRNIKKLWKKGKIKL